MGNYMTHEWDNGAVTTVERVKDGLSIRIQGEDENMLTDVVMGTGEALCLAQAILSVLVYEYSNEEPES